jgi:hypothetical protein
VVRSTAVHGRPTRTTVAIAARSVPAGAQVMAVELDERLAGEVGQVGPCQLAQFRALVLKRLDQAGSRSPFSIQFWSSRGVSPADSQSSVVVMPESSYNAGSLHARLDCTSSTSSFPTFPCSRSPTTSFPSTSP